MEEGINDICQEMSYIQIKFKLHVNKPFSEYKMSLEEPLLWLRWFCKQARLADQLIEAEWCIHASAI